jgi:hypothetical protein
MVREASEAWMKRVRLSDCGNPRVHDKVDQVISEVYGGIELLLVV